jgi:hypothetical protein
MRDRERLPYHGQRGDVGGGGYGQYS